MGDLTELQQAITVEITDLTGTDAAKINTSLPAAADPGLTVREVRQGQTTMANSVPVTIASNQDSITVDAGAEKTEDSVHSSGDTGNFVLAVRNDTAVVLTSTDLDYSPIAVDSAGRVMVSAGGGSVTVQGSNGGLTDISGSITVGGTSQQLAAANSSRRYLFIQNVSVNLLWIDFGVAAVEDSPSIKLNPNASFTMDGTFISKDQINIIGPITGRKWTAKEG